MPQGLLPFKYEVERETTGLTALAGLPVYLDLAHAMRLTAAADHQLGLRRGGQGWTDGQMLTALLLLNLAGGDCVEDLKVLQSDEGLRRVLEACQLQGMPRKERRALQRRWRSERVRTVPSASAVFRWLKAFHEPAWDKHLVRGQAWIPATTKPLSGFSALNALLLAFVQRHNTKGTATLDMDATLIETFKREALHSYKGHKAYQPLNVWWAEQELFVHTEFRSGNVPAGFEQKRVLEEALDLLPKGVQRVRMRSDTAGYQHELLRFCESGAHKRFGRIEFAVGCPVDKAFKRSVAALPENAWQPLQRLVNGRLMPTGREWAEVCHVTDGAGTSKHAPIYRYLVTREPLEEQTPLPGLGADAQNYPFPTMDLARGRYKVHGVVTNMDWAGDELIRWLYERCGKSEQAHGALKEDLAGGKLPSGCFGANAAWWWVSVLAFNLNAALQGVVLGEGWKNKRMKAMRFHLINIAGRVINRARQWLIRLNADHPALEVLLELRRRITLMCPT